MRVIYDVEWGPVLANFAPYTLSWAWRAPRKFWLPHCRRYARGRPHGMRWVFGIGPFQVIVSYKETA